LELTADWGEIVPSAGIVLLLVPAQRLRENAARLRPLLHPGTVVVHGAKGLEMGSLLRMTEVLAEELPDHPRRRIAALSGPNLAREIAAGKPAATVVAAPDRGSAGRVQTALMTPDLRVYTSTDVIGVELAGALKNIIAVGAGIADGLDVSNNAKAALITRGLAEIARLGVAMGAQPMTFSGLAGMGDLVATCYSPLSRNRHVGQELAAGRALEEILSSMPHVAEGVWTTRAAQTLARQHRVEMPIVEQMHRVLFEGADPRKSVGDLMNRPACAEWPDFVRG
jgi:glycerol-3-phosphate dehydrogenase (NAD(P)+)